MHNYTTQLKNDAGNILELHQEMEEVLVSFYDNLLSEENIDREDAQHHVISHIPLHVTEDHNDMLMRSITLQEVETTINQMKEDTAPGPNGFTVNFFHGC